MNYQTKKGGVVVKAKQWFPGSAVAHIAANTVLKDGVYECDGTGDILGHTIQSGEWIVQEFGGAMPTPLTAIQLLWLNLVTNGIQDVALAFEPAEGTEMRLGPRPSNEGIFNGLMLRRIAVTASVIGIAAFAAYRMLMDAGWSLDAARNAAVLLMVLFENVMVLNSRSETMSFFDRGFKGNRILVVGTAMALGTQVLAMHWTPARDLLGLGPIPGFAWGWTVVVAASLLLVVELDKLIWRFQHARTA